MLKRALLLLLIATLLSGCVWLRLLDTQRQLADFEQHFRSETGAEYRLNFLHPRMLSEDFVTLSGIRPTPALPESFGGELWPLRFRKTGATLDTAPLPGPDLVFALHFDAGRLLMRWDFPREFLAMAPPEFLEASIRALGWGKIHRGKRQITADAQSLPGLDTPLPQPEEIVRALGETTEREERPEGLQLTYRYRLEGTAVDAAHETNKEAVARLLFDPTTRRLIKLSGRFAGLKISIDYRRFRKS